MTPREIFLEHAQALRRTNPTQYFTELRLHGTRSEILEELRLQFEAFTPREILEHARDDERDLRALKAFMDPAAAQLRLAIDQLMIYLGLEDVAGNPVTTAPGPSPYESVRNLQRLKEENMPRSDIVYHANRLQAQALTDGRADGQKENDAIKAFVRSMF